MGMAILTAVYVILGGYMATASMIHQGIIMLAGIAAIILSVLSGRGGYTAAVGQTGADSQRGRLPWAGEAYTSFFGPGS